ncbi:hypothetical protein ABB37_06014 [Leptomonas pyrrhocoris]|uniref:RRM domain-containing protein n=1 Tax=Leptomonas pyrrhocoris TaxID=157538 RepID=A0A0M9FYV9_LEPPY|nr:hypothetical protein ABB37_06014 [Leptomonas pyrrhocoris]KPA78950.1 hypothetical protein ABB37_06014 [Leptomonas pyrrhocoris]|eukprot:XP_015657389.1 hypothetical protein ABB37_06014 [Leptomonas pyrrhocoris]
MASIFTTSPNSKAEVPTSVDNTPNNTDAFNGFEVVAGDYMPNTDMSSTGDGNYPRVPYTSKRFSSASSTAAAAAALQRVSFHQSEEWLTPTLDPTSAAALDRFHVYGHSPVSDAPSYDSYERAPMYHRTPPPPPPPLPPTHSSGMDGRLKPHPYHAISSTTPSSTGSNPYTYRGPNADYGSRKQNRLHQDFKALPKEERQRLVEREAATSDLLARTVHLRFLPLTMRQSELAEICSECGEYLRVRICGNATNNQNWIYGFVEFATTAGAEALMRRSGMELKNGPGRPPLRLKCNCAKQPIVDRVFHDADPATGNPCIFGLGNFAKRSLGDALESYYNLKEKEANQMSDLSDTPTPIGLSPTVVPAAARPPMRLSPHARAFQPAATAMLGAEMLPGVHNASSVAATISTPNASSQWTPSSLSRAAALQKSDSDAGGSGSSSDSAGGVEPTTVVRHYGPAPASSSGTTPPSTFTPPQGYAALDGLVMAAAGAGTGAGKASTLAPPRFASAQSDRVLSPDALSAGAPVSVHSGASGVATDLLLPPSRHNAAAAHGGASTPSEVAGSELSLALQNMMLSRAATDGEEVLERGQELALRAIGQAHDFLNSQQGFYDAMGTLRSLIELLDCHAAVTGGASATGAGDHTADLPQRATQLRLLANLMMALLYMMRRNLSDALPYIHAVVMSCNEIPVVCLWKAASASPQRPQQKSGSRSSSGGENSTPSAPPLAQQWQGLAVGDSFHETADNAEGYDCFSAPADFLEAVLESLRDEEEGVAEKAAAVSNENGRKSATGPNSVNGDTVSTSSSEMQALLRRDQAFHRYVLNVLVAIGLSMEEVQPAITRSTYTLAAGRARDVLNVSCEDLDECLQPAEANPRLSDHLYGPPLTATSKRDITFFPRLFFSSAESVRQKVVFTADKELFWHALPPQQCVQCYVE